MYDENKWKEEAYNNNTETFKNLHVFESECFFHSWRKKSFFCSVRWLDWGRERERQRAILNNTYDLIESFQIHQNLGRVFFRYVLFRKANNEKCERRDKNEN